MTTQGLRDLLTAMQALDGPKTLILMSEGFGLTDDGMANELAALAAATRTSIYALKLDNQLFEITNSRAPVYEPLSVRNDGLEALDRRGARRAVHRQRHRQPAVREHRVRAVRVLPPRRPVGSGRPRRQVACDPHRCVAPRRDGADAPAAPERAGRPQPAAQSPRRDCRQLDRAAADVGAAAAHRHLRLAWTGAIQGATVDSCRRRQRLHRRAGARGSATSSRIGPASVIESPPAVQMAIAPVMNGVPGALQYSGGASLDPGEYTIKLAVAEGDRVGSVEHVVHASAGGSWRGQLSELMVGGPVGGGEIMRPTVGYTVSFGSLHGYLEAYGPHLEQVAAKYEIATAADEPGADGGRRARPGRWARSDPLHAGDAGRQAAAGRVRAPRHRDVQRPAAQDAHAAVRDRAARGVDDVSRRRGAAAAGEHRAVPAGRGNGADSSASAETTRCGRRSWTIS